MLLADMRRFGIRNDRLLPRHLLHNVSKHLIQRAASDHFVSKRNMPWIDGFRACNRASSSPRR
jgi:hypothetical protein